MNQCRREHYLEKNDQLGCKHLGCSYSVLLLIEISGLLIGKSGC